MRKLHSLSGLVPVGLFVVLHLWTNARAMQGRQEFDRAVAEFARTPYLLVIEVVGIYLPLLFHALYGLRLTFSSRPNVGRYPSARNWMYTLQRVTGILALGFIGYHLWQFRIQTALGKLDRADYFPLLCSSLSGTGRFGLPYLAIVYLLGIGATVFHFANGVYGFCFSWGITVSRRATRWVATACGLFGIVLFVIGASTVVYFATGSRLMLSPQGPESGPPPISCKDLVKGKAKAALDPSGDARLSRAEGN